MHGVGGIALLLGTWVGKRVLRCQQSIGSTIVSCVGVNNKSIGVRHGLCASQFPSSTVKFDPSGSHQYEFVPYDLLLWNICHRGECVLFSFFFNFFPSHFHDLYGFSRPRNYKNSVEYTQQHMRVHIPIDILDQRIGSANCVHACTYLTIHASIHRMKEKTME